MGKKCFDGDTYYDNYFGYIFERINGKWVRQHKYKIEKELGRKLKRNEVVHHKDGNKTNNDVDNLEIMTRKEHIDHHRNDLQEGITEESRLLRSQKAREIGANLEERKRRSERAKKQHQENNFGRHPWKNGPDHSNLGEILRHHPDRILINQKIKDAWTPERRQKASELMKIMRRNQCQL